MIWLIPHQQEIDQYQLSLSKTSIFFFFWASYFEFLFFFQLAWRASNVDVCRVVLPCGRPVGQCGGSGLDGHAFHRFQGRAAKCFECFQYLKGKNDVFTQVASRLRQSVGAQRARGVAQSDPQESALKPVFSLTSRLNSDFRAIIRTSDPTQAAPQYPQARPRYAEMVRIKRLTNVGDFYARRRTLLRDRYLHH